MSDIQYYSELRAKIKKNYLINVILRIDFEDIYEFNSETIKEFNNYLLKEGFTFKKGELNELSFNIQDNKQKFSNLDFDSSDLKSNLQFDSSYVQRTVYGYNNEEKNIRIEITPFFIVINKNDKFYPTYERFEYFKDILNKLIEIIKTKEEIVIFRRIGIRKINRIIKKDKLDFLTFFNDFLVNEINNPYFNGFELSSGRIFEFQELDYKIRLRSNYGYGTVIDNTGIKVDVNHFIWDIDVFQEISKSESVNVAVVDYINNNLDAMNNLLFKYFINCFKSESIRNSLQDDTTSLSDF